MTQQTEQFGDQTLGAFVDGELDAQTREAIILAMEQDTDLRERVYRLRRARDLMKLGFGDARPPAATSSAVPRRRARRFPLTLAASVAALAVGFGAGMLGQHLLEQRSAKMHPPLAELAQSEHIILHVGRSDPVLFRRALDYTERFLREHHSAGDEIEVVAHGSGLDLMRADVSPLRDRISRLIERHNNVHFVACANAIKMLREKGQQPQIIPGIRTDTTTFDHIVGRLQHGGWQYLRAEDLPEV